MTDADVPPRLPATAAGVALAISVNGREVVLVPEMLAPSMRTWPADLTGLEVESLAVKLHLGVLWSSGHHKMAILTLCPQPGAQLTIGGPPQEAERWTSLLVCGEQSIHVSIPGSASPACGSTLRRMCQHSWEEQTEEEDGIDA